MNNANESRCFRYMLTVCIWAITVSASKSAEVPIMVEKIVVHKGVVFAGNRQKNASGWGDPNDLAMYLHAWILDQSKASPAVIGMMTDDPYLRWTIAHNLFWSSGAEGKRGQGLPPRQGIDLFYFGRGELELLKRNTIKTSDGGPKSLDCAVSVSPLRGLASPVVPMAFFLRSIYYDLYPVSEKKLQVFILTNVPWAPPTPTKPGEAPEESQPADSKTPKWSLTVHTSTATWVKKDDQTDERWAWSDWIMTESLPVHFQERFQIVADKETYYFITESGKVYLSKKPEKGKGRTLEELWTDKEQPVVAFVQDADNERTYVFTKNKKKDAKNVYFELADKLKPVAYKLADVKPPKDLKEPLKSALPYVQILIADGKIKAPKAKE